MNRVVKGQIHSVSIDFKIVSIQIVEKLEFFYLQPRFVKQFRKYLYPGVFVTFTCEEVKFKMRRKLVSKIIAFEKIIGNRYHRKFAYFDQKITQQNIIDKIKQYQYRLFLDLEMTLQRSKLENEEIIQVGAILVDQTDQVVLNYNQYIKPTAIEAVSSRTLDFLNVDLDTIKNGLDFKDFYDYFKLIMLRYNPAVIVWGNNDKYALEKSYVINHVTPLINTNDIINLQQVHKEYYNINYELGLFNTAKIYGINCGDQKHDAYIDAEITRLIFNKFHYIAYNDVEFDFKLIKMNQT